MEITELKEAAHERGFSVIKKRASGPVTVLEGKTGKLLGVFKTTEEAFAAVEPHPVIPPVEPVPAAWTVISQAPEAAAKNCPNGYGVMCMCMDDTFLYLCAVGPCPNQAFCNGTCRGHFAQLRVFGDLTVAAIKKTDKVHQAGGEVKVFPALLPLKFYQGTAKDRSSLTPAEVNKATDGVIGMSVKVVEGGYVLLDKDGHVLDRVETKSELFEEAQ